MSKLRSLVDNQAIGWRDSLWRGDREDARRGSQVMKRNRSDVRIFIQLLQIFELAGLVLKVRYELLTRVCCTA